MRLFFIRHAQSVNNALAAQSDPSWDRSADPELTDLGHRQAEEMALFLKYGDALGGSFEPDQPETGFGITHLYTSLMLRSVSTGAIIARQLSLPLLAWEEVHERGGVYQKDETSGQLVGLPGKDRKYFGDHFPELVLPGDLEAIGWWKCRPFEGPAEWPIRARRFLGDLLDKHGGTDDRVAVISHGGFYNDIVRVFLGLAPDTEIWFEMLNAAICRIDWAEDGTRMFYHNRVDYLPPDLVS